VAAHEHPQHVGYVYTFSNPIYGTGARGSGCKNCEAKSREGTRSLAQIPLTPALAARTRESPVMAAGGAPEGIQALHGLDMANVSQYLGRYLHWSVQTASGSYIAIPEKDSFFEVTVFHREARVDDRESNRFYQVLENATRSKRGGYKYNA
jgi:tyrosinase